MAKTAAQRQADYRARHPERIAAYKAANGKRIESAYRERHGGALKIRLQKWRDENKERDVSNKREYYEKNKAAAFARAKEWQERNPEYMKAAGARNGARTRAARLQAIPSWANLFFISEIYDLARRRNKLRAGGVEWHVDHIVPLKSPLVCGLHVEHNLAVIPAKENMLKRNRYWPGMPVSP